MLLNLYADFIKGRVEKIRPNKLKNAVTLHRKIDDLIDRHEKVVDLKLLLFKDLPKVAGIAIDLYFDHLLAMHWSKYHPSTLQSFVDLFFETAFPMMDDFEERKELLFTPRFKFLLDKIYTEKWIINYENIDGLEFACRGLSKRLTFENNLYQGHLVFIKHQEKIETTFYDFMKSAQERLLY